MTMSAAIGSTRRAPSRGVARSAATLAVLLLLSSLEIHPAAASHDPGACLAGHADVYVPGASHPLQPPHAETAQEARRPCCALCLNQLQSVGAGFGQTARPGIATAGHPPPAAPAGAALRRPPHRDGARAPPLA
jgi:hypothetical protein